MPPLSLAITAALILIVAFLYSAVGHAGASGYLAAMAIMGVAPDVMKPTALILNILVATITTIQFARAGHFRWSLFWPFAVASIPLAYFGGRIILPPEYYKPAIGLILLFSAWRMLAASLKPVEAEAKPPPLPIALGAGAVLGFISGLTGTGGGIFLSPLMLICKWADPKKTGAVSAAFILVNSIAGIIGFYTTKGSIPTPVPAWAICAIAGGLVGSYLGARRFNNRTIRRLLAAVLVIAGAKLLIGG